MERDIVEIIMDKRFDQLSPQEREELKEFCTTEEEFFQLKSVFAAVEGMTAEEFTPRSETKEKLDALFYESYPAAAPVWYSSVLAVAIPREKPFYRQPLLQIAAVVALILLAVPLFNSDMTNNENLVAEVETPVLDSNQEEDAISGDASANQEDKLEVTDANATMDLEKRVLTSSMTEGSAPEFVLSRSLPGVMTLAEADSGASGESEHPDGVFEMEIEVLSISVSETPDVLELLTSTF